MVAGAKYLDNASRQYTLALADDWNERIEEWCYVAGSSLDVLFGLDGHYVRIGQRTLSATPLAWAHSELVKLAWTRASKTPAEQLTAVTARYGGQAPAPSTSFWRLAVPLTGLVTGRDLVVEDTQPFTLHYGFGDPANWTGVADADSVSLPFGMYGVTLTAEQLSGQTELNFIRRYGGTWDPSGDHTVPIVAAAISRLQHQSGR